MTSQKKKSKPKGKKAKITFSFFHFLLLSLLIIIFALFVSSTTFSGKNLGRKVKSTGGGGSKVRGYKTFTPIPVINPESSFPILSAQGVLAVDLDSRIPLYEKNPDTAYLPASTVKIITALVAQEVYAADDILIVQDTGVVGQKMGLFVGENISAENLINGLLIHSANDAAEVLAQNYCPPEENFPAEQDPEKTNPPLDDCGREAFIFAMNKKANDLHLENTHYTNPSGLDGGGQVTTARDLIRIAEYAMGNDEFSDIVALKSKDVKSADDKITHRLTSTNQLLGEVDGVLGVKTGWTENARENLVTYLERDGKRIMIAILGSQDRFGETKQLINWTFDNYVWEEVSIPVSE